MVWPKSIECQLMSGNAGDFYVIGGTSFKEFAEAQEEAKAKAEADGKEFKPGRRTAKIVDSQEKEQGEWNQYDIVCDGASIVPHVNGVKVNQATDATVCSGQICLQSEGAPIQFRNVYIEPVK
jgi:hypothetical protein